MRNLCRQVCHLWFNADFVVHNYLAFSKDCIDKANKDKTARFSEDFGIEVFFEKVSGRCARRELVPCVTPHSVHAFLVGCSYHPVWARPSDCPG